MAGFENTLANIPGLGGYLAQKQMNEQQGMSELQQLGGSMGILAKIQAQQQDQRMRGELAALGPNPTQESLAAVAARYAPAKDILTSQTASLDRKEAATTRAEMAQANREAMFERAKMQVDANLEAARQRGVDAENLKRMEIASREHLTRLAAQLRPAPQQPAPSVTQVIDPLDPTKMISVDTRTYNESRYRAGDRSGVIGVAGKEPAAQKKAEMIDSGRDTVTSTVMQLKDYYDKLNSSGGIVNQDRGALTNMGAWAGASAAGQTLGGMVGTKNQNARDSIAQQRPLLLRAIMQATGMNARQMDSNAELKLWLATATDPQKGYQANMDALNSIAEKFGKGGFLPKKDGGSTDQPAQRQVKRTGTLGGRKVVEYSDGTMEYQ